MQTRTIAEWLHRKQLITDNEFLAAKTLALLIEWRDATLSPMDSTVVFAKKFAASAWSYVPTEFFLQDKFIGTKKDGDDATRHPANIEQVRCETANETVAERLRRKLCTMDEWRRLKWLFKEALPERPDMLTILGQAVTQRIGVRDLPHLEVPLICSALYIIKEHWRMYLLEDLINDALGLIEDQTSRPKPRDTGRRSSVVEYLRPERLSRETVKRPSPQRHGDHQEAA